MTELYLGIFYLVINTIFAGFALFALLAYVTMFIDVLAFKKEPDYERNWRDRRQMASVMLTSAGVLGSYALWIGWREVGAVTIVICLALAVCWVLQNLTDVVSYRQPLVKLYG